MVEPCGAKVLAGRLGSRRDVLARAVAEIAPVRQRYEVQIARDARVHRDPGLVGENALPRV